jgi:predicted PurR-regulated permease PerM
LIATGATTKGVLLFAYGALGISLVDNFMRPMLIGNRAKLPIFLLFFGMLGGVQVYGPIGILTGPLLIATVLAFTKIYREQFQLSQLRKREEPPPAQDPLA